MKEIDIQLLLKNQKEYFSTNVTKEISFRLNALKKLRKALIDNENALMQALWNDLHKSAFEAYSHELAQVLNELNLHIRKLGKWAKPEQKPTPLSIFPSKSRIYKEPLGTVLIVSPWNYPLLLLIDPLVGAISAGNTVVLKPSPYLNSFSAYIDKLIKQIFPAHYIAVVHGGRETNQHLLAQKWDYIFFTGSSVLGKIVMKAAAENLTPVTLELGGKSPCIVDEDANLKLAAKRIVWGKFMNGGQTCIAPDYLQVHKKVKNQLVEKLKQEIRNFFGENAKESTDYCRIVNSDAFTRLKNLLSQGDVIEGGIFEENERYIAPTIIDNVLPEYDIMKEEIFGPILPVLTFENIDEVVHFVNSNEKPLAFYYFSRNIR